MKETNISGLIPHNFSVKTRHFILKVLNPEVEKRMEVEEMLEYSFDMIPKLTLNKYLSFNKTDIQLRETEMGMKSEFSGKHLDAIKEVFGDASPIRSGVKSGNLKGTEHMKVSMEVDSIKSRDKISLVIPGQGDSPRKIKKSSNMFKLFQIESNNLL